VGGAALSRGYQRGYHYGDERGDAGDLLDLIARPDWHRRAACRGRDDITWFPRAEGDPDRAVAITICFGCEVRQECLEWSLCQPPELDGIWGGRDRRARQRLQRLRQRKKGLSTSGVQ
jgi:hypothetical protein